MEEKRKNADLSIVAAVVLVLLLVALGAYVGCYYATGSAVDLGDNSPIILRSYGTKWQATIFKPAAMVESWCRGVPVSTVPGALFRDSP